MIYEYSSYRTFLKETLAEKVKKNSKYSLRALAKHFDLAPSSLSEVLNGRGNFSLGAARKVATKLDLGSIETEYFCLLVQLETSLDPVVRDSILQRMKSLSPKSTQAHDLSVDLFKQIAEWYHSAILEMVHLPQFDFTPLNVAKRLGISKIEAEVAIDRLFRLELLEKDPKGKIKAAHEQLIIRSNAATNQALKRFLKQMLVKASEALDVQAPKERVSGYETLPLAPEALPEAQVLTEKYFQDMIKLGNKYPKKKNIYHLVVHFFNLTKVRKD